MALGFCWLRAGETVTSLYSLAKTSGAKATRVLTPEDEAEGLWLVDPLLALPPTILLMVLTTALVVWLVEAVVVVGTTEMPPLPLDKEAPFTVRLSRALIPPTMPPKVTLPVPEVTVKPCWLTVVPSTVEVKETLPLLAELFRVSVALSTTGPV